MFTQTTHVTLLQRLSGQADTDAWTLFCQRYGELIRGFAMRQGLQSADCDDVLQDVLVALTKSMPGFTYDPAKGKFRSYLKTVVLHAIYRRSCQKRGEVPLEEMSAEVLQASQDGGIDQHWESEWRQHHLRLAMQTIAAEFNAQDRGAFQAYAVEGRSARQTADELGLTLDQIYQAKSRILRRLSELIEQQTAEEG